MNMCPLPEIEEQMEVESRARIGAGDNPATDALLEQAFVWVCCDQDFVIHSLFISVHETEASARKRMLHAARGYMDAPNYNFGDLDDSKNWKHWEDRFWWKDICAIHIERKAVFT